MKYKILFVSSVTYFVLSNIRYIWEGNLPQLFELFVHLYLFLMIPVFIITFLYHVYVAVRERFNDEQRLYLIGTLAVVVVIAIVFPKGVIDIDKLIANDVLIAQYEGVANCTSTLQLKDNFTYKERSVCFGVDVERGTYQCSGDTIYLKENDSDDSTIVYAVIENNTDSLPSNNHFLRVYHGYNDTIGLRMDILNNTLIVPKSK